MNITMEENTSKRNADQGSEGDTDVTKTVPMAESIRYRKRAQSAEKKAEDLAEQLAEANQKVARISGDLDQLQIEQKLTHRLISAGVTDLEAAVLLAKARMKGAADDDVDVCLEQLKKEKGYLFGGSVDTVPVRKTAGAKGRRTHSQTTLERAAGKAARTGHRTDLQEYLRLRRNLI
ncbi:MAG: hypothetical protein JW741_02650 [Sedimentisphaerales bacterium]|nr:hypothetical protein [Sedimentisphaerales bacterium]